MVSRLPPILGRRHALMRLKRAAEMGVAAEAAVQCNLAQAQPRPLKQLSGALHSQAAEVIAHRKPEVSPKLSGEVYLVTPRGRGDLRQGERCCDVLVHEVTRRAEPCWRPRRSCSLGALSREGGDDLQHETFAGESGEVVAGADFPDQTLAELVEDRRSNVRRLIKHDLAIRQVLDPLRLWPEDDLARATRTKRLGVAEARRKESDVSTRIVTLGAPEPFREAASDDDAQRGLVMFMRAHRRPSGIVVQTRISLIEHGELGHLRPTI